MKRFKNTFGVTGSVKQLEAFAEWAEEIWWKFEDRTKEQVNFDTRTVMYFNGGDSEHNQWDKGTFWLCGSYKKTYHLPSQWLEAMAAASEVEETVFEVGKKYRENIYGTVVLCTDYSKESIQGVCIVPSERHELGEFRTKWCKQVFTPYNEPVTI